jgi:hypothetical protein
VTCHRRGEGVGRLSAKRSGVTHPLRQSPDRHATRRGANACQPFAARRRYVRTLCRRLAGGDPRAGHAILAGCHDTALLSDRTRIRAWVKVSFIVHQTLEGKPKPEYLTVTLTNIGLMPANISMGFFQWKLPFHREYWLITPWDYARHDPWVPQRVYPTEIKPRSSQTFFLQDIATFRFTMAECLQPIWLARWASVSLKRSSALTMVNCSKQT